MSKLNASDIQGFAIRGYNMPFAATAFFASPAQSVHALCLPSSCL
jgi:hypothetical protein